MMFIAVERPHLFSLLILRNKWFPIMRTKYQRRVLHLRIQLLGYVCSSHWVLLVHQYLVLRVCIYLLMLSRGRVVVAILQRHLILFMMLYRRSYNSGRVVIVLKLERRRCNSGRKVSILRLILILDLALLIHLLLVVLVLVLVS